MVTRQIGIIDSALEDQPVLRQIIAFAAADRDVIDLIGASPSGQVSVIELKAAEDIHLPLQALDYWMRVEWHIRKGELDQFFPKLQIANEFPKLVLVAPAMQFHPSNELILSYFNEQIETERIGVNLEWQQGLKVAFRLHGSEKPQSHRRSL
jgi:flavin-binding protein dodecin